MVVEAPKDNGAGVGVNPSRGPAPPSASTRPLPSPLWAIRLPPGREAPSTHPTLRSPSLRRRRPVYHTAVRAFLASESCDLVFRKTLGQQLVARVPLAGHPAPAPVGSLLSTSTKEELPCRRPEAVPRALRSPRSRAVLATEGGACRFETALPPENHKARADAGFLFYSVENPTSARESAAIALSMRQRKGDLE